MKRTKVPWVTALLLTVVGAAAAQNVNPDISVIGDVRAFATDDASDPKEGRLQLDLKSVELALQGYLNPYARADVFLGYHDDSFELEEAYATILRGLPGGLQVKAGKYRVDFGKLNLLHPHAYSFLDTPLVHRELLGEEGLVDIGVNLNLQAPLGNTVLTVSGNVLKGDFAEGHHHEHAAEDTSSMLDSFGRGLDDLDTLEEEAVETDLGYSERLGLFVPTGDYAGFEVGLNALQGTLDLNTGRKVKLLGADAKYRWAPDKYRSLTVQGEWIRSDRDVEHAGAGEGGVERVRADGFYAFLDWRFAQRWNAGVIGERSEMAEEEGVSIERVGAFAGFQLMEETTTLRVLLRQSDGDELAEPVREAILQLAFSLGPHRAHWF
ncbi:MAG: hypothetical protein HY825_10650 [Acidobacteria bacterium]|nr:hypothetical protein [Acidobacteriota bacterium]